MKVNVNSKEMETKACNLLQLSEELILPAKGVAMAVNNMMIPRSDWATQALKEGDQIVIIKAACGG